MNLQDLAAAEKDGKAGGKLRPHREAILALRRKRWTYLDIAKWLNAHGVPTTLSSVQRVCQRAVARRARLANSIEAVESQPLPASPITTQPKKCRFNLDI